MDSENEELVEIGLNPLIWTKDKENSNMWKLRETVKERPKTPPGFEMVGRKERYRKREIGPDLFD